MPNTSMQTENILAIMYFFNMMPSAEVFGNAYIQFGSHWNVEQYKKLIVEVFEYQAQEFGLNSNATIKMRITLSHLHSCTGHTKNQ